jgi:hypothetical protein
MMFKLIISTLITFLSFSRYNAYLTNMDELKRQYDNYLQIHRKSKTENGFELFVENLQRIESFNSQNSDSGCRLYLTQYSDTIEENAVYKRCNK